MSKVASELSDKAAVEGSDFREKFNLLQFHFHWGFNDFQGSEHLVEGEKFPLEVIENLSSMFF